jgi:hypothetical protein
LVLLIPLIFSVAFLQVFRPGDDMDSFMSGMKNEYDGGGKSKPKRKGKKTNKDDL